MRAAESLLDALEPVCRKPGGSAGDGAAICTPQGLQTADEAAGLDLQPARDLVTGRLDIGRQKPARQVARLIADALRKPGAAADRELELVAPLDERSPSV